MNGQKGKKRIVKVGMIAVVLCAIVGVTMLSAAVVQQQMTYLFLKKKLSDVASGDPNLPPFITSDMMQALFETQEEYGIPVSTGIAQIIQESGFGLYGPNGESGQGLSNLAYTYKNLFGIKFWSGDSYASGSVNFTTGEQTSKGEGYTVVAGFSVYSTYADCIRQRASMLTKSPYKAYTVDVYKNNCDGQYTVAQANGFMSGIRAAGWATDISYVQSCTSQMEKYNLYVYDNMDWSSYQTSLNTGSTTVIVGKGSLCNPCPTAYISSEFGGRASPGGIGSTNHKGRDYAAASGTAIYAAADGTVELVNNSASGARGKYVIINHGKGLKTLYQHCSTIQVSVGQTIKKGQRIALVGSTGNSTGPHLHFEVWVNNVPVDPRTYL